MRRGPGVQHVLLTLLCAVVLAGAEAPDSWQIGPLLRPAAGNPVVAPDARTTFVDAMSKSPVHWEALHTFNPAAVVRNGKVAVVYRAEDATGTMQIGMHTSRLGLAESSDGIQFTGRDAPVFYPGCADSLVAVATAPGETSGEKQR